MKIEIDKEELKETKSFLKWGVGMIGIAIFVAVGVSVVRKYAYGDDFIMSRAIIGILLGIILILISRKLLRNEIGTTANEPRNHRK